MDSWPLPSYWPLDYSSHPKCIGLGLSYKSVIVLLFCFLSIWTMAATFQFPISKLAALLAIVVKKSSYGIPAYITRAAACRTLYLNHFGRRVTHWGAMLISAKCQTSPSTSFLLILSLLLETGDHGIASRVAGLLFRWKGKLGRSHAYMRGNPRARQGAAGTCCVPSRKRTFFCCIFIISSFLSFQNTLESFYVACLWTVWLCLKSQSRDLSRSNAHKNRDGGEYKRRAGRALCRMMSSFL